jgi:hypothetical protein
VAGASGGVIDRELSDLGVRPDYSSQLLYMIAVAHKLVYRKYVTSL